MLINLVFLTAKLDLEWLTFVMKNVTMLSSGGMNVSLTGFSLADDGVLPILFPPITFFTSLSLCLSTSSVPSNEKFLF